MELAGKPDDLDPEEWARRTIINPSLWVGSSHFSEHCIAPQVAWFWAHVRGLDGPCRRLLLQLVTEREVLPAQGPVMALRVEAQWSDGAIPVAHTCSRELVLPAYSSPAALEEGVTRALENYSVGPEYNDA